MLSEKRSGAWQVVPVVLLVSFLRTATLAQKESSADDLKKVIASSTVEKNVYSNEHVGFRLALPEPPCDPKLNTKVDLKQASAVLLDCEHVVKGWQGMYTLTVAIDYRANYPVLQDLEQYVRSWRHAGEREKGNTTLQTERARRMAGMDFVDAILSSQDSPGGRTFYQRIACTQMKGYLLCFIVSAPSVDEARSLMELDHKLELTTKSTSE
jgi:hypothetical protein